MGGLDVAPHSWSFLDIKDTRQNLSDNRLLTDIQLAVVAGTLEGKLTASLIQMHYLNTFAGYCDGQEAYCDRLTKFVQDNDKFLMQLYQDLHTREGLGPAVVLGEYENCFRF